jgi:hypothetical protein
MKIHGLRICPQSVNVLPGHGAPIFVHGSVSEECSDFFYIFRPLAPILRGHVVANDFTVSHGASGREDPIPRFRKQFGSSFVAADLDSQIILLKGDDFLKWGAESHFCEGAFLSVFPKNPGFAFLNSLCRNRDFKLNSTNWPSEMRAVLHIWDDMYWQLFSVEGSDIDLLVRAHAGDPRLKMYFVDFDREFPDPSDGELQPAVQKP